MDNEITDEYDQEFINLLGEIEKRTEQLKKHDKLRIKSWCKKLCQITNNTEWKKNRNLHAIALLDSILNERFEDPYNKFAPDGPIKIINKTLVKSKLSQKFLKNTSNLGNIQQPIQTKPQQQQNQQNLFQQRKVNNNNHHHHYGDFINPQNENFIEIENSITNNLKKTIQTLQEDNNQKQQLIDKLQEDKNKLIKRVQTLEQMLSSFMELENK
jgi:hypothetical protein